MRNRLTEELAVCGFNAALALGTCHPEKINRLFLREDRLKAFSGICKYLAAKKHPYKICGDEELERLCKSNRHQGVVAMIPVPELAPAAEEDLDLWAGEGKTGIVLDSIGNDHNLGAIARCAAFFDVHFVILGGGDRENQLSTSAYRVAEGGMEYLSFRGVNSAAAFLRAASGRIVTIGADPRARWRVSDLGTVVANRAAALKLKSRPGIALVLGNEESGLSGEVKENCSALIRVPGTGNIESLNVAQATALFLHEIFEL
ncbi:MAG: RNA methyltransferase [Treponema sp.]|jgi:TrmH RNA methyltransferase|nr:RNA methyltransferase [Treponema sp.]